MRRKRQGGAEETSSKSSTVRPSGETAPKRRRVSRACDQCRAAREKCDGIQPLCFPCASQNRSCSWEEPKKKRGVQTGYIRTLEIALGWIFDKIPESEEALHGLLTHEGGQGRLLLAGKHSTSTGTRLHRRWRKSTVHAEIERVLSGSNATSTRSTNDSTPSEESDEDDHEKGLLTRCDTESASGVEPAPSPKTEGERSDMMQPKARPPEDLTTSKVSRIDLLHRSPTDMQSPPQPQGPNTVSLPSHHWRLLDIYFSYTHIWFPILERHEVLKTGYAYPDEGLHLSRDASDSAGHAELWAALALASYQETASRTSEGVEAVSSIPTYMKPREIYHTARNLIPLENGDFEARHINALLLLSLVNMACNDLRAAWMLIGMASRVALSLRLHENLTSARGRQSSHTYMGCFILDTLVSAQLGLLPHLRSDLAYKNLPRLDNDLDEWQPWMPCPDFGPFQRDERPSRMPSHSVSSFNMLHRIHLVLSHRLWDKSEISLQPGDAFLTTLQSAVSQCGAEKSLSSCVLTGERLTGQLPSIHVLRLAFLSAASQCRGFPYLYHAVLNCVESYIGNFGICGLPPLFSVFIGLVDQQEQSDSPKGDEKGRREQVEKAIGSVWIRPDRNHESDSGFENIHPVHRSQQSNSAFGLMPNLRSQQQSSTTALLHPHSGIAHDSTSTGSLFSQDANTNINILNHSNHQPNPEAGQMLHLNASSAAIVEFEDMGTLTIQPSMHFPVPARPNFSGAALDYDTILDDIASIEHTNLPESDSQFMANLGLRPGTNLADVFSHEFMGFS
ncbi:hypothetical protein HD806DRAFT_539335 [Xylariaceae sp. AK1471]|nr:hypothetical protein HD806DRAFT_539335 [Xylariaceae sp. AK1471]